MASSSRESTLATAFAIASWFVLNIAIGSSTKWIFLHGEICEETVPKQCRVFKFPVTITVIHMVFSWMMCYIQLYYIRGTGPKKTFTFREQFEKVAPLSACFCGAVAMGNVSLKYIYPSFNQMLGAVSPLITVGLAVLFQGKRFNWWTWASMPVICGGLIVCSSQEVNFNALGASFATGATVLRAMKSIIQGKLLQGERMDSVTLLYYMAPWAAMLLSVLAVFSEGFEPVWLILRGLPGVGVAVGAEQPVTGSITVLLLLLVSGLNACLLNVCNFAVTSFTSAVTLQVLGNVKNCLSIIVSVAVFGNALKLEQALGVAVCLSGVWLYNKKGGQLKDACSKSAPESKAAALVEVEQKAPALAKAAQGAAVAAGTSADETLRRSATPPSRHLRARRE